jgi:chitin synthase
MECYPEIGGCCGFMSCELESTEDEYGNDISEVEGHEMDPISSCFVKMFSIQHAQRVEYDFAHLIDKPFESLFGFVNVLPGAFSGYRFEALKNFGVKGAKKSIMDEYLKTTLKEDFKFDDLREENRYLAEDRILCLQIFTRQY